MKLDRKQDPNILYQDCVFGAISCSGGFVKKVAHGTQVQDMWPFGPLVICTIVSDFASSSHTSYWILC